MGWRLAPLGRYLDVRPSAEFESKPMPEAANIPFDELAGRLHELPPKEDSVSIADFGPDAERAVDFLKKGGRETALVNPASLSPSPFPEPRGEGMSYRLWRPNAFLEETLPHLTPGRALDLGCGAGREALAMAAAGFQVSAVDLLPDALKMGRDLERRYLSPSPTSPEENRERRKGGRGAGPIDWTQADLEERETSTPLPPSYSGAGGGRDYDLITSFRYLNRPLLRNVFEHLNPGGSLLLETFTDLHRERHGRPRQDAHILQLGEAPTLVPGLEIVRFDEDWRGERHMARLWARKTR